LCLAALLFVILGAHKISARILLLFSCRLNDIALPDQFYKSTNTPQCQRKLRHRGVFLFL